MIPVSYFLILSIILFVLGAVAFFVKRDLITQFMAIEIMFSAANLAILAFAKQAGSLDGQIIGFFVITVAAVATPLIEKHGGTTCKALLRITSNSVPKNSRN